MENKNIILEDFNKKVLPYYEELLKMMDKNEKDTKCSLTIKKFKELKLELESLELDPKETLLFEFYPFMLTDKEYEKYTSESDFRYPVYIG